MKKRKKSLTGWMGEPFGFRDFAGMTYAKFLRSDKAIWCLKSPIKKVRVTIEEI
jgi:hypothetical protein